MNMKLEICKSDPWRLLISLSDYSSVPRITLLEEVLY